MNTKKIGEEIEKLRKEKGLTQKELAERLHVSSSAVSKWERGVAVPDVYMLQTLAEQLGVSVSELIEEKKDPATECIDKPSDSVREKKGNYKWILLAGSMVVMVAAMISCLIYRNTHTFRAEVVDEFLDTSPDFFDYKSVYHVVIEFDGDLTYEISSGYAEERRDEYAQWFEEADIIMFSFWEKNTYKGRDHVLESGNYMVLLPMPDIDLD